MKPITKICMDGMGKMGGPMTQRLRQNGIEVIGYDHKPELSDVATLEDAVDVMRPGPAAFWLMLPLFAYETTLDKLANILVEGDTIIDGGNTYWEKTRERHARFSKIGIHYVDVGTSGGIYGLEEGYALMVGSTDEEYEALLPVFRALAPSEDGLVHAGPSGAGHYAKMVHNGIEYGIMQALGEGYNLLSAASAAKILANPTAIFESWRHGSIVKSFALDMAVKALNNPDFANVAAVALDSGEGRWTVKSAIDLGVSTPVISAALNARLTSQGGGAEAVRLAAGVRHEFGGHDVVTKA